MSWLKRRTHWQIRWYDDWCIHKWAMNACSYQRTCLPTKMGPGNKFNGSKKQPSKLLKGMDAQMQGIGCDILMNVLATSHLQVWECEIQTIRSILTATLNNFTDLTQYVSIWDHGYNQQKATKGAFPLAPGWWGLGLVPALLVFQLCWAGTTGVKE